MHSPICVESSLCGKHSQEGNHWAANQIHHARMGFIMFLKPMDALEDHLLTCRWTSVDFIQVLFGLGLPTYSLDWAWVELIHWPKLQIPYPSANLVEFPVSTGSTYLSRLSASLVRVRSGISTRWALFWKIGLDYLFAHLWTIVAVAQLVGSSLSLNNEALETARWLYFSPAKTLSAWVVLAPSFTWIPGMDPSFSKFKLSLFTIIQ